jgi:hypothetical protein
MLEADGVMRSGRALMTGRSALSRALAGSALAVMALLALDPAPGRSQPYAVVGPESDLRIEWEQHPSGRGPVIAGYVHNASGMTAANVRVLVEGLDGTGRPVSATVGYVVGTVPGFNRTYFELRAPGAASYRVSVVSYEWIKGGGGGGM